MSHPLTASSEITRRPSPVGALRWPWRFATVRAANRPRLIGANRYPGQIIGIGIRLPAPPDDVVKGYPVLSILWARPSRWWK